MTTQTIKKIIYRSCVLWAITTFVLMFFFLDFFGSFIPVMGIVWLSELQLFILSVCNYYPNLTLVYLLGGCIIGMLHGSIPQESRNTVL